MSSDQDDDHDPNATFMMNASTMSAAIMSAGNLKMSEFKCRDMQQSSLRDEWTRWIRGTENVLAAGDVTDPVKKKQLLLAWGGLQLQDVFYSIPSASGDANDPDVFKTAVDALTKHFSPKQHDTYERHKFWSMKIENGESIDKFFHRVRQQANNCYFGSSRAKSREIGIIDKVIASAPPQLKEMLLQKPKLDLEILEKTVNSYQAVKEQARLMSSSSEKQIFVNKLNDRFDNRNRECERCGYKNHKTNDKQCPALKSKCFECGNVGHFANMCRRRKRPSSSNYPRPSSVKRFRSVRQIESRDDEYGAMHQRQEIDYQDEEKHNVYNVGECDDLVWCKVGGTEIEMCIDSGSKHNLIDDKTFRYMKENRAEMENSRFDDTKKFLAYGKYPLKLLTVFDAMIRVIDGEQTIEQMATFYVIENGQQPLLEESPVFIRAVTQALASLSGDGKAVTFDEDVEACGRKENERRGAKTSDIDVGDTVLMKNLLGGDKFKLNFNKEEFIVVARNGAHVTIREKGGDKVFERNVAHLKKIPMNDTETVDPEVPGSPLLEDDAAVKSPEPPHKQVTDEIQVEARRPVRMMKKPLRFQDYEFN
uniref:CSON004694 protein n=1 Tax=Culicoides sonorensis TaxID=179676 RepID=A0A336M636_CULSO